MTPNNELKPGPGFGPIHELLFRKDATPEQMTNALLWVLDACDQSDYSDRGAVNAGKLRHGLAGRLGL